MLKELLKNIWMLKKESSCIIAVVVFALFILSYAQGKGKEKAIENKMEKWESENYHLTSYRKGLIIKACLDDFDNADSIINAYGILQPNFDR